MGAQYSRRAQNCRKKSCFLSFGLGDPLLENTLALSKHCRVNLCRFVKTAKKMSWRPCGCGSPRARITMAPRSSPIRLALTQRERRQPDALHLRANHRLPADGRRGLYLRQSVLLHTRREADGELGRGREKLGARHHLGARKLEENYQLSCLWLTSTTRDLHTEGPRFCKVAGGLLFGSLSRVQSFSGSRGTSWNCWQVPLFPLRAGFRRHGERGRIVQ